VPQPVADCVAAAGTDSAKAACSAADNYFDSVLAIELKTGRIRWVNRVISYDTWTVACLPLEGIVGICPSPHGPDHDFAQAPALFKVRMNDGGQVELVGAGQKSGEYRTFNPDTGAAVWKTNTGPGGTAGGLQWGSAVDGKRIYIANSNSNFIPWTPLGGELTMRGGWSALDAATGQILWQRADQFNPAGFGGGPSGPVTTANGLVFGCSLDPTGHMYALNAATGAVLWSFASGGSCLSGAAISEGMLFWGSGYSNNFFGTANHKLYAFALPQ
jgi:polyvinyl alcohol dehydrogenase (cytochrome)